MAVRSALFEDRGATLIWTVSQLPMLTDFDIYGLDDDDRASAPGSEAYGLPRCQELAELRSRSLTRLRVCMLDGPEECNTLRLAGLPELRSLDLYGEEYVWLDMQIDETSLSTVPQLHALHLRSIDGLHLQPGSLAQLTALTALRLIECGLHGVPGDVALLRSTLRVLDVSNNVQVQVDSAAMLNILACSELRTFGCY